MRKSPPDSASFLPLFHRLSSASPTYIPYSVSSHEESFCTSLFHGPIHLLPPGDLKLRGTAPRVRCLGPKAGLQGVRADTLRMKSTYRRTRKSKYAAFSDMQKRQCQEWRRMRPSPATKRPLTGREDELSLEEQERRQKLKQARKAAKAKSDTRSS